MVLITIDLPDELVDYLNHGKYIGDPSRLIAYLIRRWQKELAIKRGELSSTQKPKFEEAIRLLVKKLKTTKAKPTPTFSGEDGTPYYEGFHISQFLVQMETELSSDTDVLKIFDTSVLVDFSEDTFLKVLQAQVRDTDIQIEEIDSEHISLERLEGISQSI